MQQPNLGNRSRLPAWLRGALLPLLLPGAAVLAADWVEIVSPHFVVRSDAGAKKARRIALQFEQVRAVLHQVWPWARLDEGRSLLVVAARDESSFKALLPALHEKKERAEVAGVFQRGLDKHLVVLRADAANTADAFGYYNNPYHTAYHEYVHLVLELNFREVPAWLSEGLAEYWGDVEVDGGRLKIGQPVAGHVLHLRRSRLVSIDTLLRVDTDSPHYWERGKADVFYAQSWALVHYLTFEPSLGAGKAVNQYAALLRDGQSPEAAAAQALPEPASLRRGLEAYLRRPAFRYVWTKAPLPETAADDYRERALLPPEVLALRGELLARFDRREEGRRLLQDAARLDPRLVAPEEALGVLELLTEDYDAAAAHLRRAALLESTNAVVHYLRGIVAWRKGGDSLAEAEEALVRAAQLNHDYAPTYAALAAVASMRGAPLDRTEPLARRALKLEPGVGSHRLLLAQLLAEAGRTEDARAVAEEARAMSRTETDRADATKVLEQLARMNAPIRVIELAPASEPTSSGKTTTPAEAVALYQQACSAGDARACLGLGMALERGVGVSANEAAAGAAYEKACALDPASGCLEAGLAFLGRGRRVHRVKAAGFFQRSCAAEELQACHDLAHLYDGGIGVAADKARARALYEKACKGGHIPSCQWLKQSPAR